MDKVNKDKYSAVWTSHTSINDFLSSIPREPAQWQTPEEVPVELNQHPDHHEDNVPVARLFEHLEGNEEEVEADRNAEGGESSG